MITVDWRDLGIPADAEPFANGAVGELFRVPNEVASLPGRKLVFKRVKKDLPAGLDPGQVLAQMRSVVSYRDGLSAADLTDLDEVTVWPLAMVRQKGDEVGVLIDLIADEFFVDAKPSGHVDRVLFELQFLCVSDNFFAKRGIDRAVTGDDIMRLALSARLAYAIEILHRGPVVFGDLHLKNAVAASRPFARVLLMDCDSVAQLSDPDRVQLHGFRFEPPELTDKTQRLQDQRTDVYKLGLCIVRALSPGKGATQASRPEKTKPGLLDAEGIVLLQRALGRDRDRRPTARELREYLTDRVQSQIQLPELLSAGLSHRVVMRGSDVFVRWQQRYGTEVRIFGANGFVLNGIDPTAYADGYAFQPSSAGPIDVEVWNRHGPSQRVRAGYLDYYELPALDLAGQLRGVPRPVIPEVPALDARVFDSLRPYPTGTPPELTVEISAPVLGYPAQDTNLGRSAPTIAVDGAHQRANETIRETISDALRRMTRSLSRRLSANAGADDP